MRSTFENRSDLYPSPSLSSIRREDELERKKDMKEKKKKKKRLNHSKACNIETELYKMLVVLGDVDVDVDAVIFIQ